MKKSFRDLRLPCLLLLISASCSQATPPEPTQIAMVRAVEVEFSEVGVLNSKQIKESSGLAFCSTHSDCLWTHNDSGDGPRFFLITTAGRHLATVNLEDAKARDWEAMDAGTINGRRYLVLGDVGDNGANRKSLRLYFVEEPAFEEQLISDAAEGKKIKTTVSSARILEFAYEDGPRDCEAIAMDGANRVIWIIEKLSNRQVEQGQTHCGVYSLQIPPGSERDRALIARRVATLPMYHPTGICISPDGRKCVIRSYRSGRIFARSADQSWRQVFETDRGQRMRLPHQLQGEAICFGSDSRILYSTSEQIGQPIWQIKLK